MGERRDDADRYELQGLLGRGGMGVVYRARERESGRLVALKLLETPGAHQRLARFEREGQVTAALSHPGIVRVHSTGLFQGKPYLAYELVEGAQPLSDALRATNLRERARLIRDVAEALGFAHARGVVHRDVKPDNVLVDAEGRPRVLDFGLAVHDAAERLTQTGALVGTPRYMAPEQYRGETVGPAADVWALGIMLYEGLSGLPPFEGHTLQELLAQVLQSRPPRPRELEPAIPVELEAICLHALEREPSRRYPDGSALARDLDAWLKGRRPSVRPPPWSRPLAATILTATILLGGVAAWVSRPRETARVPTAEGSPLPSKTETPEPSPPSATQPSASSPSEEAPGLIVPGPSEGLPDTVKWVMRLAQGGDPGSLVQLGNYHRQAKHGFPRDASKAAALYRRAAELGSLDARLELAQLHRKGLGVPQDYGRAAELVREAAEAGDPEAKAWLGWHLESGYGVDEDTEQASVWYRRAVTQDEPMAKLRLATLLLKGRISARPGEDALVLLSEAAAQGLTEADLDLGLIYLRGAVLKRDTVKARFHLRRAEAGGNKKATAFLANLEAAR